MICIATTANVINALDCTELIKRDHFSKILPDALRYVILSIAVLTVNFNSSKP